MSSYSDTRANEHVTTRKRVVDEEYITNAKKQSSYRRLHSLLLQILEKAYYEVKTIRTTATNFGLKELHPEEKQKIIYQLETSFVSQQRVEDIDLSSLSILASLTSGDLIEVAMQKVADNDDLCDEDKEWWNVYFVRCKDFLSQELVHVDETLSEKGLRNALESATKRLGEEKRSVLDLEIPVTPTKKEELPPDEPPQITFSEDTQAGIQINVYDEAQGVPVVPVGDSESGPPNEEMLQPPSKNKTGRKERERNRRRHSGSEACKSCSCHS